MRSLLAASVIVCGLFLVSAASSDEPKVVDAAVKGLVIIRGKPATGRIFFHLNDGQFAGCRLKGDGKFAIDRIPTGEYSVTIEGEGIPKKYSEEQVTPLRAEVKNGTNTIQFDLP